MPQQKSKNVHTSAQAKTPVTPRDVFLHLLLMGTLYAAVISTIVLLFQYIELLFPDQLHYSYFASTSTIRSSTAVLLVVWPVFLIASWILGKGFVVSQNRKDIWIRKWLIYLTLLIASITMMVELVQLIYSFLGGELTVQFVLKVLVVLITAGAVFSYFVWDLRRREGYNRSPKILAWIVSIVLLFSIVGGFFVAGSPMTQRDMRLDEQRVWDLQTLQSEVINYWASKRALPEKIQDLENSISGFTPPKDPQTGGAYTYRPLSSLSFELCADFSREQRNETPAWFDGKQSMARALPPDGPYSQNWSHGAGTECFTRTIDPDYYPDARAPKFIE